MTNIIIDNRKKRIQELLGEAKKKPRDSKKIYMLRQKLIKLREEDFLG